MLSLSKHEPGTHARLELVDEAADDPEAPCPEGRVGGVEAEGRQQLLVALVPPAGSISR